LKERRVGESRQSWLAQIRAAHIEQEIKDEWSGDADEKPSGCDDPTAGNKSVRDRIHQAL
jgi:hypothetical protein